MYRDVPFTDQACLAGLRRRDPCILQAIYQHYFPTLRQHVYTHGGSLEDAEDVFQEAMVVVYRKANEPDFVLSGRLHSYLLGVGKKIWLRKASRRSRQDKVQWPESVQEPELDLEAQITYHEKYQFYREKLAEMDEGCQRVLRLFCEGRSMREIAKIMGYKSESYAKKRKFQCKQKLMELIRADQRYHELCT